MRQVFPGNKKSKARNPKQIKCSDTALDQALALQQRHGEVYPSKAGSPPGHRKHTSLHQRLNVRVLPPHCSIGVGALSIPEAL